MDLEAIKARPDVQRVEEGVNWNRTDHSVGVLIVFRDGQQPRTLAEAAPPYRRLAPCEVELKEALKERRATGYDTDPNKPDPNEMWWTPSNIRRAALAHHIIDTTVKGGKKWPFRLQQNQHPEEPTGTTLQEVPTFKEQLFKAQTQAAKKLKGSKAHMGFCESLEGNILMGAGIRASAENIARLKAQMAEGRMNLEEMDD